MIRHSQSYLFGAISGTAVIAAAVVFFVLFVSAQALRDWPIGDLHLGGGNDSTAVSPAESLGAGGATNAAAANLSGPITGAPTSVAPGAKATGAGNHKASNNGNGNGKVSAETRIEGGRGVDSAPVQQPSSTTPATPAPTGGNGSSPAGSGTASPAPSGGNGASAGSGQDTSTPPSSGNVGTKTARRVTNTVNEISSAATPPAPSPVTAAVGAVAERIEQTPPPSGSTTDRVGEAIAGIGN